MNKMLKGSYQLDSKRDLTADTEPRSATLEFEDRAMERLGGSIAFIMKGNKLVWDEEDEGIEEQGTDS